MHKPKDKDEHADTEVLDDREDTAQNYDPDATAVLDNGAQHAQRIERKK